MMGFCFPTLFLLLAAATSTTRAAGATTVVCPRNAFSSNTSRLDSFDPVQKFTEISGLVFSKTQLAPKTQNPVFYVVTDGGRKENHTGRVGVYDSGSGERLLTYAFSNHTEAHFDFESMTLGSCGGTEDDSPQHCIYVGDIGDNVAISSSGRRSDRVRPYRILKFREPNLLDVWRKMGQGGDYVVPDSTVWILPFHYKHKTSPTPFADSEAIFVDHVGWGSTASIGDLYLVTKWGGQRALQAKSRVFRIPVSAWNRKPQRMNGGVTILPNLMPRTVGNYNSSRSLAFRGYQWRGADMLYDGTIISLTTKNETHLFWRCPGESVGRALTNAKAPCTTFVHAVPRRQIETSAWTSDGLRYLQIPEGPRPRMGWFDMVYDDASSQTRSCPALQTTPIPSQSPAAATTEPTAAPGPSVLPTLVPTTTATIPPTTPPTRLSFRPVLDRYPNIITILGPAPQSVPTREEEPGPVFNLENSSSGGSLCVGPLLWLVWVSTVAIVVLGLISY